MVVVIVITVPPSTKSARDLVTKATKTSFMVSENEKVSYDNFESKVANTTKVNKYIEKVPTEMKDVQLLSENVALVLDFYDNYILFIEGNSAFNNSYKTIKNGLNNATQSQKNLNAILKEVGKLTETSPTYIQSAWVQFRAEYVNWLGNMKDAINGLSVAFQGCMGNVTINNSASALVLNTTADYVEAIYNGFSAINQDESSDSNRSDYTYNLAGQIASFENFVDSYLIDDEFMRLYYFQEKIQTTCETLEEFFEKYSEENLVEVISSIDSSGIVQKQYDDTSDSSYVKIKEFLGGILIYV